LPAIEFPRLSRGHAAVVLLGEPWRAAARPIAVATILPPAVTMPVARVSCDGGRETERGNCCAKGQVFHLFILLICVATTNARVQKKAAGACAGGLQSDPVARQWA